MIDNIENTIVQTLLGNIEYFNKVFSHIKKDHFQQIENIEIFNKISEYYNDYQTHPKPKEVGLLLKNIKQDKLKSSVIEHFKFIMTDNKIHNLDFIINETEKYVKKMEMTKAILEGADAIQNDKELDPIYGLVGDALKINFDADLGLKFDSDLEKRLSYYKRKIQGMSTGVKSLDDLLGGGYRKKTLNVVASVSHGGKSTVLAHIAAYRTLQGDCGLYYTLEMSEEETCKRIDGNVFDLDINLFKTTPDEVFIERYNSVKNKLGDLVVKEYPAGSLDVLKMESHMNDFFMKYDKKPNYICIDYLTLMKSSRANLNNNSTYNYYKLIAEELHAFSKKYDIPVITAAQVNRSGYGNRDAGMENVSDSLGIAMTADTFCILIRTKELDDDKKVVFNFVKNRNTGLLTSCIVGVDFPKMRFYDVNNVPSTVGENVSKFEFNDTDLSIFD